MSIAYDSHVLSGEKCMGGLNKQGGKIQIWKYTTLLQENFGRYEFLTSFVWNQKGPKFFVPDILKHQKVFKTL